MKRKKVAGVIYPIRGKGQKWNGGGVGHSTRSKPLVQIPKKYVHKKMLQFGVCKSVQFHFSFWCIAWRHSLRQDNQVSGAKSTKKSERRMCVLGSNVCLIRASLTKIKRNSKIQIGNKKGDIWCRFNLIQWIFFGKIKKIKWIFFSMKFRRII